MLKFSQGDIESYASDISELLESVPLYYVFEILELANEKRQKESEIEGIDITSEDESEDSDNEEDQMRWSSESENED